MPLKVTAEPAELLCEPAEHCVFCNVPTRYWYEPENAPCCRSCCRIYSRADVQSAMERIATDPCLPSDGDSRISRGNVGKRRH